MTNSKAVQDWIIAHIKANLGDTLEDYHIPPPVFDFMQAEFISFDSEGARLVVRFPILESYLNPYGAVQGGMIAAAVDNALGPLSVLVAPPNLTRRLELTYSKPIKVDMGFITVHARLLNRKGRQLVFAADVRDPNGFRLARAKATHWIIDEDSLI
jgi:acyl-coenzyme A thioesterase PaaI-like protein